MIHNEFYAALTNNANPDQDMKHHFAGVPHPATPMAVLSAMLSTLSRLHPQLQVHDNLDLLPASIDAITLAGSR